MAIETIRAQRNVPARVMAERLNVSRRTVQRIISEPRQDYEHRLQERQNKALKLRQQGLTWQQVGDSLGGITRSAAYQLAAKARARVDNEAA